MQQNGCETRWVSFSCLRRKTMVLTELNGASTILNAWICTQRPEIGSVRRVYQLVEESTNDDDVMLPYISMCLIM